MSGRATGHLKSLVATNIREAMGDMTSAELANRLQTHERNVRRWRNGEATPTLPRLTTIADELGREVAWFYTDHNTAAAA
jgi:transcriptional regulator with XRE-family HTH domain